MSDKKAKFLTKRRLLSQENGIKHWEQAQKILLMQRFLEYTRNKVLADKIDQEFINEKSMGVDKDSKVPKILIMARHLFDFSVSLINIYLCYLIPFRLAFYSDNRVSELWAHDLFIDFILLINLILRICYKIRNKYKLVPGSEKLSYLNHFTHLRLYTDALSVIPLYLLSSKWYWLKIGRLLRFNSLSVFFSNKTPPYKTLRNFIINYYAILCNILTVLNYANMIAITCHCIACLWFFIPNQLSTPNEMTWLGYGWENYSINDNYMRSLYWTAVTFSSVGYGDITGKTTEEYIYSMFVEFLGIMFFAYLMGSITSLISYNNLKQEKLVSRENELTNWLIFVDDQIRGKETQNELKTKISSYFQHKWACDPTSINGFEDYFMMLPQELSKKLSSHLFGHRLEIFESLLKYFPDIQFEIASKMETENFLTSCEVLGYQEPNQNIYLIISGNISIGIPDLGYCLSLSNGAYFGEDSAIFGDKSPVSFYSSGQAILYYFNFEELKKIFKKSKQNIWNFSKLSFKRSKYFFEMIQYKFSSEFYVSNSDLETFSSHFNLDEFELTLDQELEFNRRAKNFIDTFFLKKTKDDSFSQEVKKNAEKLEKNIQGLNEKFESEMNEVISRVNQAIIDIKNSEID